MDLFNKKKVEQLEKESRDAYLLHYSALMNMAEHFIEKCPEMTKVAVNPAALVARYIGYAAQGKRPELPHDWSGLHQEAIDDLVKPPYVEAVEHE